jgi:type I restriction enzyme S subunit
MTGATAGKVGRIRCADDRVLLLNQRVAKLKPRSIEPDFFWHVVSTPRYRTIFHGLGGGAAQPNMSGRQIEAVEIPFPPPHVQASIGGILSAYDDLVENNRRRMALLEEGARQLYREWFVRLRFPGHEHTPMNSGVPEGWDRQSLAELVDIRRGKNITKEVAEGGSVAVVAGGLEPAYFHNVANARGPVVTISASGANAGYVNIYLEDIWASDCSFISSECTPHVYYFYCQLKHRQSELFALQKGAAQPHVYPKDLHRLDVVNPPTRLLQDFTETVQPSLSLIANLSAQIRQLRTARDLLLPRLMSGDIVV